MEELIITEYDIEEIAEKIVKFLENQQLEEVNLNYYSLEDDDELIKEIDVMELKDEIVRLHNIEEGYFFIRLEDLAVNINYTSGQFRINYPEELEEEIKELE